MFCGIFNQTKIQNSKITMKFVTQRSARWLVSFGALIPLATLAQTLTLTNGIMTFTALTNTTVTMTGRCELEIMASTNPIPGCIITLATSSPDAWLLFPNIRPSLVSANYLDQVRVNGVTAVAGSNCRVDQFVMGTVVIPQLPSYMPLQVYSAQNFLGASAQFGIYTYYTNNVGGMSQNISSFRLKHGYATTFAQNADGTGASQVFIAQDSDLEVGVMPTNLDHHCSFVRVYPWRWTGKKGWVGGLSSGSALIDPLWNYDYDNVATSTINTEYVPMRDTAYWDDYANINSKQKSTQVLAFNEPDQANQANMTVAAAIAQWPSLMQSGLRVGAPAVSSSGVSGQGLSWLYSFMSQATNLGYRVDYVPVHLYQCSWTTTQFSNYLAGVYQTTGKPVWVTEFNDTDFSSGCSQSQSSEASDIGGYISMMESCPFVERYSIYEYFDPSTSLNLVTTNNPPALTPAGVVYHNQQSAMAYTQTLPPAGNRGIAQFEFETNTLDCSGFGNNGFAVGIPSYAPGHTGQSVALDGTNSFIELPPSVPNGPAFTFAAWVYWNGGVSWQRIFDFGNGPGQYMFLTPSSSSGTLRFSISTNSYYSEQIIESASLPVGQWQHVAVTISGSTAKLYTNGVLAASSSSFTLTPATFKPALNYLGKSQFPGDPLFHGQLDEVFITDSALSATQIAALKTNLPPQFYTNFITLVSAAPGIAYSTNIAGMATNLNPGDTLTYSKASGPSWLNVAANGALTGTPNATDAGTNNFTARVTDVSGVSGFANIFINVTGLLNGGFELPSLSTYAYNPSGATWSFTAQSGANGSGITANNSAFTSGNTNAPEGAQCAFLQGNSAISQAVSGFIPGAQYNVTFAAAQRAYSSANGGQTWQVRIDGTVIGTFIPSANATNYVDYTTNFTATSTTHTLRFVGTDLHGGDNTVFLDNVRLTFVSPPAAPAAPANLVAVAGDGQVTLTWNAATFATGYNVKRSITSGGGYVTNASLSTTFYTDTSVTNGTMFYYVVSAVNSGGEGPNSSQVSALPVSLSPPQLIFEATGGLIQILWPADHLGWTLQIQTNYLSTGLGTNWISIPNSTTNMQFIAPLAPENPSVFYRLIHQ
jgi:hypothetical protein